MLIPARTDTSYFHDYIFHGKADEVRFIRGRLTFTDEDGNPTKDAKGRPCSAPFPSAVVIWRSKDMAQSLRDMVLDLIKDRDMTANEIAATLSDRGAAGKPQRRRPDPNQSAGGWTDKKRRKA